LRLEWFGFEGERKLDFPYNKAETLSHLPQNKPSSREQRQPT
jgi:hypothetical protein